MVNLSSLLTAFAVASSATANRYALNRAAKISLFEASTVSKAPASTLTDLDCGPQQPSTEVTLPVDNCLWGDYFLVNSFKITTYPQCGNGATAVAFFYSTTSCTGKPTFRSDQQDIQLSDRCLFGSSPEKWSMIFRCSDFNSQAVTNQAFQQAKPPQNIPSVPTTRSPTAGVLTPYFSYDCTIYRPKQPTTLPVDTCLTPEVSHSIFISQPAICANGKPAVAQTYDEESCISPHGWLGYDVSSKSHFESLDKRCYHFTDFRSIAFVCEESGMRMFGGLPVTREEDVEPLTILALPLPKEEEEPVSEVGKQIPLIGDKGGERGRKLRPSTPKKTSATSLKKMTVQPYFLRGWFKALIIVLLIVAVITGLAVWGFFGVGGVLFTLIGGFGGWIGALFRRGGEREGQIRL
jgi:hypothetical protein